ncbi:ADP-ribosylation factor-like protein 11 [Paramormyrops kingsleyae]|uniref:ADP-ribosylation factor-like protein 11 n=1 Tax=Paramormyrops kingsleyae TaxID=1676925 RepID=UPI000CD63AF2|nr:ADP-ribosylation factor-like protein 11 [Paramormyrops kingsleyae]XP_023656572.1 ADP-ribosylation factor-like protein 11 [Paramormyrops kingsleyae]XP_023656662.1 ADP-ribosylation factor-like protein 11 [Paramormyrops kingsleyae]
MGLVQSCSGYHKPLHVVLLGLDSAGKSTIFYRLRWNEDLKTQPTIGFNVGMQQVAKNIVLTLWDVGGQDKMRLYWKHYLEDCRALVFVVDSSDRGRIREAARALRHVLAMDSVKGIPLIVLANKCDLPNIMNLSEVATTLGLNNSTDRDWVIQPCSGLNGQGLQEAFQAIAELIKDSKTSNRCL